MKVYFLPMGPGELPSLSISQASLPERQRIVTVKNGKRQTARLYDSDEWARAHERWYTEEIIHPNWISLDPDHKRDAVHPFDISDSCAGWKFDLDGLRPKIRKELMYCEGAPRLRCAVRGASAG